MSHIYIIDDEESIRENLAYALRKEGYKVSVFGDGEEGITAFYDLEPDLIVLDILMPRMDGLEFCKEVRRNNEHVPIIFLSSKDDVLDRVLGLEIGGDDYLCKPFSIREMISRIKVVLKRSKYRNTKSEDDFLIHGEVKLHSNAGCCKYNGTTIPLTVTEVRILESLFSAPGIIKSRDQLMSTAFPEDVYSNDRAIDSHIKRLRKKLDNFGSGSDIIETVYGMGYRLKAKN